MLKVGSTYHAIQPLRTHKVYHHNNGLSGKSQAPRHLNRLLITHGSRVDHCLKQQ